MDRIAALNEILTENPKDAFARYGLAMEYSKQGDFDRALAEFSILIENHPDYTAGYFMAAQTLARAERPEEAKKMLRDGIVSAQRTEICTPNPRWKRCSRNWVDHVFALFRHAPISHSTSRGNN